MLGSIKAVIRSLSAPRYHKYAWYPRFCELRDQALNDFQAVRFEGYQLLGEVPVDVYRKFDTFFEEFCRSMWGDENFVPLMIDDIRAKDASRQLRSDQFYKHWRGYQACALWTAAQIRVEYRLHALADPLIADGRLAADALEASLSIITSGDPDTTFKKAAEYETFLKKLGATEPTSQVLVPKSCPDADGVFPELRSRKRASEKREADLQAQQSELRAKSKKQTQTLVEAKAELQSLLTSHHEEELRLEAEIARIANEPIANSDPESPSSTADESDQQALKRVRAETFDRIVSELREEATLLSRPVNEADIQDQARRVFAKWVSDNPHYA